MSVLVKGMEMPKNCDECPYSSWSNFYQIYICNATRKHELVLFDRKQVKSTNTMRSGRADNCPLVPIPPHGRLIDADALKIMMPTIGDEYLYAREMIEEAPTIIPAEEEQE